MTMLVIRFAILFLALLLDRVVGDPPKLWARAPHPVVLFGKAIGFADRCLNKESMAADVRRNAGVAAIVVLLLLAAFAGLVFYIVFTGFGLIGLVAEVVLVSIFLAQKGLADHVQAVSRALVEQGLEGGRRAVSRIVGRDPRTLDYSGVCRASIESLAENFSDGVVAPAFWYAVLGLPGLFAYKMLNTADSMIGHKSEKYLQFGWASARLDDLANYIPARLSVLLIALGARLSLGTAAARRAYKVARSDHGFHRSPNSGWPEAAMAGALDLQLAGPRVYAEGPVDEPVLNAAGSPTAHAADIGRAVTVFYDACLVLAGFVVLAFLAAAL